MRLVLPQIVFACCLAVAAPALAQGDAAGSASPQQAAQSWEDRERGVLKGMLDEAVEAINAQDVDKVAAFLADDVVIVFQNADTLQGIDQLNSFMDRMLEGDSSILTGHAAEVTNIEPAHFVADGQIAIGWGTLKNSFTFRGGKVVELESSFVVTLEKRPEGWRAVTVQFSSDIFDNPLLDASATFGWLKGAGGLLLGAILGALIGRRRKAG